MAFPFAHVSAEIVQPPPLGVEPGASPPSLIVNPVPPAETLVKPLPPKLRLSPWTREIVKLAESKIDEGVMLTFIDNSGVFSLGAEQIIYLSDVGVSSQVLAAMLQHDREIMSGQRQMTLASEPELEPLRFFSTRKASDTPRPQPAPTQVTSDAGTISNPNSSSGPNQTVPEIQPATHSAATPPDPAPTKLSDQHPPPERERPLYPVRKPYPVRFLPSIIFINAPDATPDAVIVAGFAAR
jgi:hypothetical protein